MFLMFAPFYGLILTANLTQAGRVWRYVALAIAAALSGLLCLGGIIGMLDGSGVGTGLLNFIEGADPLSAGILAFLTGATSLLLLIDPVRSGLIKLLRLNLDPDDTMHSIAMIMAVWFLGGNIASIVLTRNVSLDTMVEAYSDQGQGGITNIWAQGLVFAGFAILGVGLGLRRSMSETLERLGLRSLTVPQILLIPAAIIALLTISFIVSFLWTWVDPESSARIDELSNAFLQGVFSPIGALSVGLAAGIGEELLFRGAVQPRFGLLFTSLMFTLAHNQYEFSFATLNVFAIALILGLVRQYANTTACILIHAGYNTTLMLFSLALMPGS